jgi:hypothetical protein
LRNGRRAQSVAGIETPEGGAAMPTDTIIAGQSGWEEVADYALTWAEANAKAPEPVEAAADGLAPATQGV